MRTQISKIAVAATFGLALAFAISSCSAKPTISTYQMGSALSTVHCTAVSPQQVFYDRINETYSPNINTCVKGLDSLYGYYDRIVDIKFKGKSFEINKPVKDAVCAATVFMCDYSTVFVASKIEQPTVFSTTKCGETVYDPKEYDCKDDKLYLH